MITEFFIFEPTVPLNINEAIMSKLNDSRRTNHISVNEQTRVHRLMDLVLLKTLILLSRFKSQIFFPNVWDQSTSGCLFVFQRFWLLVYLSWYQLCSVFSGSQQQVSKLRSDHEMSEGVIGRGCFDFSLHKCKSERLQMSCLILVFGFLQEFLDLLFRPVVSVWQCLLSRATPLTNPPVRFRQGCTATHSSPVAWTLMTVLSLRRCSFIRTKAEPISSLKFIINCVIFDEWWYTRVCVCVTGEDQTLKVHSWEDATALSSAAGIQWANETPSDACTHSWCWLRER